MRDEGVVKGIVWAVLQKNPLVDLDDEGGRTRATIAPSLAWPSASP